MTLDKPLSAMVSYQAADYGAAELLHEELALRGFVVVHDRCSFTGGARIAQEMEVGVQTCDAFIAYLTPNSLYLDAEPDSPQPALQSEFIPAMQRRREPTLPNEGRPLVVLPIAKGLGSRSEASKAVFEKTGEEISSLWVQSAKSSEPSLEVSEASDVAAEALSATLAPGALSAPSPVPIVFATRGAGQAPRFLTIDATSLVGVSRRAGSQEDWGRILKGLRDVERILAKTHGRKIDLVVRAHISGGISIGRVFSQAGGWHLSVQGRFGAVQPSPLGVRGLLNSTIDYQGSGRDLTCEISLVGQPVFDMARETIQSRTLRLAARIQLTPRSSGEFDSETTSLIAAEAAWVLRDRVAAIRPPRTHLFCASPIEVAVLLGYRLTSLNTELHLYEREGTEYRLALVLPADLP